jgi:uncharacterized flavoprotein (TIGR03862 family)
MAPNFVDGAKCGAIDIAWCHLDRHLDQNCSVTSSTLTADVAVIGAGPAGLAAAETAATAGASVVLIDSQRSPGRKFLLAGRSGLNMTHSEPLNSLLMHYSGSSADWIRLAVSNYPPTEMRNWADGMGIVTFVGSSGRVFPVEMRATPLLRAWLTRLGTLGVRFESELSWRGSARLEGVGRRAGQDVRLLASATVLTMGGASWPRTGSDGKWADVLGSAGVTVEPFGASNVGVLVDWSGILQDRFSGQPIKNVIASAGGLRSSGDVVITRTGLEGGPIYSMTPALRSGAVLELNLRPDVPEEALVVALRSTRPGDSLSNRLRKVGLSTAAVGLLLECGARSVGGDPALLARFIRALPIPISGIAGIDRAISTSGGIAREMFDAAGMLHLKPGVFVAGEMVDWEAPTGGYLIQGCWSSGCHVGAAAAEYVRA